MDPGTADERIQGIFTVTGLDSGENIIVEIWLVIKASIPGDVTGNVQTTLASVQTIATPPDTIPTGTQTVPLMQVADFLKEVRTDLNVSVIEVPGPGWTVTDTATVYSAYISGTTQINFEVSTDGGTTWSSYGAPKTLTADINGNGVATSDPYLHPIGFWNTWEDAGHTILRTVFNAATHVVHLEGAGFTPSTYYEIAFYDGGYARVATIVVQSSTAGVLTGFYDFTTDPAAAPGPWHAVAYRQGVIVPNFYIPNDLNAAGGSYYFRAYYTSTDTPAKVIYSPNFAEPLGKDNVFIVQPDAIPEFPAPIAGLVVVGVCAIAYWWTRKRREGST